MPLSCCWVNQAPARNFWRVRCTTRRPGASNVLLRSTVLPFPKHCSRASCSATSEVRLQAPSKQTIGRIETANKGTLFLDEIGDLPATLQAKLLRFLQERSIERLGGRAEIPVDVRIVCATHQDLQARIAEGTFREDLFYRLAGIVIKVPPLRDRSGDAVLLAHALDPAFRRRTEARSSDASRADALDAIESHRWPGNVREMENVIKRAVIMADGPVIQTRDLGLTAGDESSEVEALNLREARDSAERREVARALARANGNLSKAADLLGVSRPTLYDLLNRFGLRKHE